MSFTKRLTLLFIFVLFSGTYCQTQPLVEREWLAVHPRVGMLYNVHTTSITNFEGVADCGIFTHGNSFKPNASLTLETPLTEELFFGLGVRYADRSAIIYGENTTAPALDVTKQQGVDVVFENSITTTLLYIDVLPELRYHIFNLGKASVRALLGGVIAFPMTSTFTQRQRIISPENAVYKTTNQQTVLLSEESQVINSMNKPLIGMNVGIENLLPVGKTSFFTQQVSLDYVFGDVVSTASWKTLGVHVDLGFRFSFTSSPKVETPVVPISPAKKDTMVTPKIVKNADQPKPLPILTARIESVDPFLQTGNELRASIPIVNAVFFDQNSALISEKYIQGNDRMIESDDALENYRSILLSVARIVKRNPKATLVLEGATSGADEPESMTLSKERAESVMSALVRLGVDKDRMSIRSLISPRFASNIEYPQGREENRRVDIIVNDAPLQEYVARQQFVKLSGTMKVNIEADYFEVGEIRLLSNAAKEEHFTKTENRTIELNQRLQDDKGEYKIEVAAYAPPFLNSRDEKIVNLSLLRKEQIELNLKSFDAILRFDYNSSDFSQANKDLLRQLVNVLPEGKTIQILGSADVIGAEESNRQLSERRAMSTENFIKSIAANKFKIESSISTEKFDDSKPEGRFLNRSIRIRVRD